MKAAETYEAMGDASEAAEILDRGYAETGDERLKRPANGSDALADDDTRNWTLETMLTPEILTVGGTPFYLPDIEDLRTSIRRTRRIWALVRRKSGGMRSVAFSFMRPHRRGVIFYMPHKTTMPST